MEQLQEIGTHSISDTFTTPAIFLNGSYGSYGHFHTISSEWIILTACTLATFNQTTCEVGTSSATILMGSCFSELDPMRIVAEPVPASHMVQLKVAKVHVVSMIHSLDMVWKCP